MKIWIYVDGRQEGPYELEQLLDKPVTPDTKVWYEGLPKWYPAGYLDELAQLRGMPRDELLSALQANSLAAFPGMREFLPERQKN